MSAVGATDSLDSFAPTGLISLNHNSDGLQPWLGSVAAPRLNMVRLSPSHSLPIRMPTPLTRTPALDDAHVPGSDHIGASNLPLIFVVGAQENHKSDCRSP
jgi:hypothetical protein